MASIHHKMDLFPCFIMNQCQVLWNFSDVPHVALYSFKAENDHELSIKQGDVVTVISRSLEGWLKVVNTEERVGWVPESFLVHVSRSQLSDTQQTVEVRYCILLIR